MYCSSVWYEPWTLNATTLNIKSKKTTCKWSVLNYGGKHEGQIYLCSFHTLLAIVNLSLRFLTEIRPRFRDKQMQELTAEAQKLFLALWLKKPFKALLITLKSTYPAQAPILIFCCYKHSCSFRMCGQKLGQWGLLSVIYSVWNDSLRFIYKSDMEGVRLKFL